MGQKQLSAYYAKGLLKRAVEYNLHDLALIVSEFLVHFYSFINLDLSKAKLYSAEHSCQLEILKMKKEVTNLYFELANRVTNNKGSISEMEKAAFMSSLEDSLNNISPTQSTIIVQRTYSNYYFYYLLCRDHENLFRIADEALQFFEEHKPTETLQLFMSRLRRAVASIYLKNYDYARQDLSELSLIKVTQGITSTEEVLRAVPFEYLGVET